MDQPSQLRTPIQEIVWSWAGHMEDVRNFLIAIVVAIVLEVIVVLLVVQFVSAIWIRAIVIAVVPVGFLLAAIFSDRE